MKKIILVLLICKLNCSTNLFSQNKDSLAQIQEMQRLTRVGDSMHRVQLAKDSAFQEMLDESSRKIKQGLEESKQKQVEAATKEVLERQDKEQRAKRKTMLLALSTFLITIVVAGMLRRKKKKNKSPQ